MTRNETHDDCEQIFYDFEFAGVAAGRNNHTNGGSYADGGAASPRSPRDEPLNHSNNVSHQYGRFDASALHIAHALKQTELQRAYARSREKPIDCYLVSLNFNFMFV